MKQTQKILFVCRSNRHRSKTAEKMYENDPRFLVRSGGASWLAVQPVTPALLQWADWVIVMEEFQKERILTQYPEHIDADKIHSLEIPDEFPFDSEPLKVLIREKFEAFIEPI